MIMNILTRLQRRLIDIRQIAIFGNWQRDAFACAKIVPVLYKSGERTLPEVEVQHPDAMPHAHKSSCNMHRGCGLPRPALFVSDDNDMRHVVCPLPVHLLRRLVTVRAGTILAVPV